jgi:hypothetical protein
MKTLERRLEWFGLYRHFPERFGLYFPERILGRAAEDFVPGRDHLAPGKPGAG